ncbi:hypothetical protein Vretifemale_16745, partial [Volvox reticuliferus]
DPSAAFSGNITVEPCFPCAAPSAVIFGPAAISQPCFHHADSSSSNSNSNSSSSSSSLLQIASMVPPSFDASLSFDPSGRSIWRNVTWALWHPDGNYSASAQDGWTILQDAIDRTNRLTHPNDRLVLSLTADEAAGLPSHSGYGLTVTLVSWLGTTSSETVEFSKPAASDAAPPVWILGPRVHSFRLSEGIRASAEAARVCGGGHSPASWLWTSSAEWIVGGPDGLTNASGRSPQLYLPAPLPVVHGQSIQLQVKAVYDGSIPGGSTQSSIVTMTAIGAVPYAYVYGPSGDVPNDSVLVFNATSSRDPDTTPDMQQLEFSWDCRREDYPNPCFTGTEQGDWDTTPGVWQVPASLLTAGIRHTITVTVNKVVPEQTSALASSASLEFRPRRAEEPFPRGTLTRQCAIAAALANGVCVSPHNADEDLTLMLEVAPDYMDAGVSWSSTEVPGASDLPVSIGPVANAYIFTIPATLLRTVNRQMITVTATMGYNGYTGAAVTT